MPSKCLNEVILKLYDIPKSYFAPIETLVTLFVIKYCKSEICIKFFKVPKSPNESAFSTDISTFNYEIAEERSPIYHLNSCQLPYIVIDELNCISGLCAILRYIIRNSTTKDSSLQTLLGFKDSCLLACSEVSLWTKFCEVDIISSLKSLDLNYNRDSQKVELPVSLAQFESHMSHPLRLHNIYKYSMSRKFSTNELVFGEGNIPEHTYAEGPAITLADIIIFVCIHILLDSMKKTEILELLPLTSKWLKRMAQNERIQNSLTILSLREEKNITERKYILPEVKRQSLYKSVPQRCKPKSLAFTKQEDIDTSLEIVRNARIDASLTENIFFEREGFDWSVIPANATPEGGSLPLKRLERKLQQLENLCKPVLNIVKDGDTIVDFCSGSGHLGILIAYLLPKCSVILLENKENSLKIARDRVNKLKLCNVKIFQSNLDYFKGDFDIGTSLHACGVATDLVIQQCVRKRAVFICCPCCYGSVHDCHRVTYPRSETFKKVMNHHSYMVLGHAADQTHGKDNVKTEQGYECMKVIDTDRKLQAEEFGYTVYLTKLVPETCTPKNNLLVGIPNTKKLILE